MHVIKSCHQHSYGYQNVKWGVGNKISKLQQVRDFSIFGSKSSHVYRRNFENQIRTFFLGWESKFLIFWGMGGMKFEFWWAGKLIFWEGGGHKNWVLVGGFNCADWTVHLRDWATTMSLRGPMITLTKTKPKAEFVRSLKWANTFCLWFVLKHYIF